MDPKPTSIKCQDQQKIQCFRYQDYSKLGDMVCDVFEHCDKDHSSFKNMIEDA